MNFDILQLEQLDQDMVFTGLKKTKKQLRLDTYLIFQNFNHLYYYIILYVLPDDLV